MQSRGPLLAVNNLIRRDPSKCARNRRQHKGAQKVFLQRLERLRSHFFSLHFVFSKPKRTIFQIGLERCHLLLQRPDVAPLKNGNQVLGRGTEEKCYRRFSGLHEISQDTLKCSAVYK